jgi:hypothetical protein
MSNNFKVVADDDAGWITHSNRPYQPLDKAQKPKRHTAMIVSASKQMCQWLTGLKYVMPIFFSIGIAMSDLHVVGLQEPPRNTSYGGGDASLPAQRNKSTTNPKQTIQLQITWFIKYTNVQTFDLSLIRL